MGCPCPCPCPCTCAWVWPFIPFGCLLGLFFLGTFDRRANANGALAGMIAGLAAILCIYRFGNVAFTWFFMIGALVTFAVGAIASRTLTAKTLQS